MGLSSSTRTLHLVRRSHTRKLTYNWSIPEKLRPAFRGKIELAWKAEPYLINGQTTIKISLGTDDDATAQARYAAIHTQVEELRIAAVSYIKNTKGSGDSTVITQLLPHHFRRMAGQVHHDILEADDLAHLTIGEASGLSQLILTLRDQAGATQITAIEAEEHAQDVRMRLAEACLNRPAINVVDMPIREGEVADDEDLTPADRLGSGLIDQIQKMTVAAMQMADMKVWAQRS